MMNYTRPRALVALLVTLALLTALASPALARETHIFDIFPQEVDFASLKPGKPDTSAFEATANALEAAMEKDGADDQMESLLTALFTQYKQLDTDSTVFNFYYTCDSAAYAEDYAAWDSALLRVGDRFTDLVSRLLASGYVSLVSKVLGADMTRLYFGASTNTPEEIALLERKSELVNQYWALSAQTYTAVFDGKSYRGSGEVEAAYSSGEIDYDGYLSLSLDLAKQSNAGTGAVFVEIVKTLNTYATLCGYDNYGEMAYLGFGRDYTMGDSAALHALVKEYFVPLSAKLNTLSYASPVIASGAESCQERFQNTDQDDIVAMVQPYMDNISSEYADLFDYMLRCGLLDIGPSETKNHQAYTSSLPTYGSALIFGYHNGNLNDASTLVHEFGHFASFCFAGPPYAGQSLDICEVNSQGLEALYFPYADEMLGEEAAPYYRTNNILSLVDSVISGCLVDEFLQTVYATPNLTLDDANRIYHDVAESYGQQMTDSTYSYGWTVINHNFESPFYYISYATSALAALDIFDRSLADYDAACDLYLNLTKQGVGAKNGFVKALEMAGLDNVFEEETVASIASALEDYLYSGICGAYFSDVEGAWFEDDALFCASAGLFGGDQNGSFLPGENLTRAQAAALLWRMNGSPEAETANAFTDVPSGAWYATAADWCAENGVITGTTAAVFSPNTPVSRQEMAVLLYRLNGAPEMEEGTLSFPDAGAVSGWAVDGVAWAVAAGLLGGRSDGTLAPATPLNRAEAATLLSRYLLG